MKIILKVANYLRNFFYFWRFSIKRSWKTSQIRKHENGHFRTSLTPQSQTPQCASHRGAKLCGEHHTWESSSAVCIPLQSQTAHRRVRIEIFESLWLFLKGQAGEVLLGVNTSIMKKKRFEEKKFDLLSLKFWLRGVMHTAESNFSNLVIEYLVEIETEFENTSTLACLSGGPDGFESWKNEGRKSRDTLPLT